MTSLPPNYNPFGTLDFYIDKQHHEVIKKYANISVDTIDLIETKIFNNMREAWILSVALGFRLKLREKSIDRAKIGGVGYINDPMAITFMIAIGIKVLCVEEKSQNIFGIFDDGKMGEIIKICEEYANGGAKILKNLIESGGLKSDYLEKFSINIVKFLNDPNIDFAESNIIDLFSQHNKN
jgi:hypothetical protein